MLSRNTFISLTLSLILIVVGWLIGVYSAGHIGFDDYEITSTTEELASPVVAVVNGEIVTNFELESGLASGFDRAVVLDRYVNKVLSAQLGEKEYPKLARETKRAAYREVLSTLYTTRELADIRQTITDEQIKAYYDENVSPENFKQWRVQYYLSNDREDVQSTLKKMKAGDNEALEQLELLVPNAEEGYAGIQAIPYGLGRVVSGLKPGEFSEVLSLRNGFMVLQLDKVKQSEVPDLEQLRDQILNILASQQFNTNLLKVRKDSKIELK